MESRDGVPVYSICPPWPASAYGDGCGIARALDLVGERWALLVVRELLLGPKRFTDLRAGLPHVGPDVLAQRLRELERDGILTPPHVGPARGVARVRAHRPRRVSWRAWCSSSAAGAAGLRFPRGSRARRQLGRDRPTDAVRSRAGRGRRRDLRASARRRGLHRDRPRPGALTSRAEPPKTPTRRSRPTRSRSPRSCGRGARSPRPNARDPSSSPGAGQRAASSASFPRRRSPRRRATA